ncbi:hypothetical protein KJ713_02690 [Patescibacteria group bacterium]|nr:hypothetical protein [Patescibacteria group bacterium]
MLWIILGYIAFLVVFFIFSIAAFYHCREYGYTGDATNLMMIVYSLISLVIIIGTFYTLLFF